MTNINSNWIPRAGQRSIISFTGRQSITIVCRWMANAVCIILLIRWGFLSVLFTFSTIACLMLSRLAEFSLCGKWERKLTSVHFGVLILESVGSFSGFLQLLFPAFTVTSWHPALLNLVLKLPAYFKPGRFITSASATTDSILSLG